MNYYKGNIVPESNTVFVFGSNTKGIHGAGSAYVAVKEFGAIYGQSSGIQGQSYALITTDLSKKKRMKKLLIVIHIIKLYYFARRHSELLFKVAYRNLPEEVTLCGYSGKELSQLFTLLPIPNNVIFSEEWVKNNLIKQKHYEN